NLRSPTSSDCELWNHNRCASADRCGTDNRQRAEFDSRETQSQHRERCLALEMKTAGERCSHCRRSEEFADKASDLLAWWNLHGSCGHRVSVHVLQREYDGVRTGSRIRD